MTQEKLENKSFMKNITYNPIPRKIARFLGLNKIFRNIYFYMARPKNGIISWNIAGINAKFYVKTPGELRLVESMGGGGEGEVKNLETLLLNTKAGDVVYDIGGNIGLYTIFLAKKVSETGRVFVFEPEKENYQNLLENIKLNNLGNITVFKKALGNKNEQTKLYIGEEKGNCSLLNKDRSNDNFEFIDVVKGDDFTEKNEISSPNIIKIDVEGYEYYVLQGLSQRLSNPSCKVLGCEIHKTLLPKEVMSDDVISLLKSFGFIRFDTYSREGEDHIICYK